MVEEALRSPSYPAVYERVSVPEVVTGEPDTEKPVGAERPTEVTVPFPVPKPRDEVATQVDTLPFVWSTIPLLPVLPALSRSVAIFRLVVVAFVVVPLVAV